MRLILIREPIITLPPLLSKMLTTDTHTNITPPLHSKASPASNPRLSFGATVRLCLLACQSVSQSVRPSVFCCTVPLSHAFQSQSLMCFLSRNMLFCLRFFESTCNKSHNYLFPASLTHTYRNAFGQKGQTRRSGLGMAAPNK